MKVGFIGLGIMGAPMAGHLQKAGHELFLHSRSGVPDDLLKGGANACGLGREVAERSEVVITMVPDTPHVEAVLFGEGGVAEGLAAGKIVVDMSSISPIATKDFARRINERLEEIIRQSDAVMVARGDLGVEMPPEQVPIIQRRILRACRKAGKPVVVATQMLGP